MVVEMVVLSWVHVGDLMVLWWLNGGSYMVVKRC